MNDVEELEQFALVHARAQGMRDYHEVLGRVHTDEPGGAGSWVGEWVTAGRRLERAGQYLRACQYYNLARFPYVDSPARAEALTACVDMFDRWRTAEEPRIERLDLPMPGGGRLRCWADGLSTRRPRPVLLIMGGIVSIKEQWAQGLVPFRQLGMASVALEMPGVGENTLRYGEDSPAMLSALLDALAGRARVDRTYALAASFSGHLALRCALRDLRIRGVASVGAPVSRFFTDREWHQRLPRITVDTLAHVTGTPFERLSARLPGWRLTGAELAALDIPVCYLGSGRDEIIPPGETDLLRRHVRRLRLVEYDDVHASPRYIVESRLWTAVSILRMRRAHNLQRAAAGTLWALLRLRHRLPGAAPVPAARRDPAPASGPDRL